MTDCVRYRITGLLLDGPRLPEGTEAEFRLVGRVGAGGYLWDRAAGGDHLVLEFHVADFAGPYPRQETVEAERDRYREELEELAERFPVVYAYRARRRQLQSGGV